MRLRLSSLLIVIALIALVLGILFMTPLFIAGAFCVITMILTPAIWLTGVIYARGIWRAFFIGGTLTGFMPHFVLVIYGLISATQLGSEVVEKGLNLGVAPEEVWAIRLAVAAVWSIPGVFAFTGGAVAMATYRVLGAHETITRPKDAQLNS
jgi:hypothetical protein